MTRKKARFVDMHVMILGLSSIVFDRKLFATASLSHSTNTNEWIEDTITDVVMLCDAWRWLHSTAQQLGVKFRIHAFGNMRSASVRCSTTASNLMVHCECIFASRAAWLPFNLDRSSIPMFCFSLRGPRRMFTGTATIWAGPSELFPVSY